MPSAAAENPADTTGLVKTVADAVLRDFPEPPPFDWGEGVLLAGMMRAHQLTKDTRYVEFVQKFACHWQARGITNLLFKQGYCGHWGPGFPLILLYDQTRDPAAKQLIDEVVQFILHRAHRTRDGGLSHFFNKPELWVDTLYMACPLLTGAARIENRPAWQEESARQMEIFARYLQDTNTGLYYHFLGEANGHRTSSFWARGNGWVAMTFAEIMKREKPDSPIRQRLMPFYARQMRGIVATQDEKTGLWHAVMEAPETYLETSSSAMFLFAMAESRRYGLMASPDLPVLRRVWAGLARQVDAQGRVIGVSAGTRPYTKAAYAAVPQGTFTWGTGAFLLGACAYAELPGSR